MEKLELCKHAGMVFAIHVELKEHVLYLFSSLAPADVICRLLLPFDSTFDPSSSTPLSAQAQYQTCLFALVVLSGSCTEGDWVQAVVLILLQKSHTDRNIRHILNSSPNRAEKNTEIFNWRRSRVTFVSSMLCTANIRLLSFIARGRTLKTILSTEGHSDISHRLQSILFWMVWCV